MDYTDFLKRKLKTAQADSIPHESLSTHLFPFQAHCVSNALRAGQYGMFEDCGMGKTIQQLEWAERVSKHTDMPVIVAAPLAVRAQTIAEADRFGYDLGRISITNYENLHKYQPADFGGVVLDESSILKNFTGKMRQYLVSEWSKVRYRLACTATPSPNDAMELGNHSEFLGAMTRAQMLSMYFVNDMQTVQKWRVKGHAKEPFYRFLSSWSVCAGKPSDLGFSDDGYELPDLIFHEENIVTDKREGMLFNDVAVSATQFNAELRRTMEYRLDRAIEIAKQSDQPCIVWCKLNVESEYLAKRIPHSAEVVGSDSQEKKENLLLGFAKRDFKVLITKPKIAQFGLNYQHCPRQIFASMDFSFEGLYQAVRRSYRFGQKNDVHIWLITTDSMQNVRASIARKMKGFDEMRNEIITIQNESRCLN